MRRSLPVINALDLVEIPIPCEVPWDGMPGNEQVRHCGQCKQNVYNVSALTRAEALRLLSARACLRIYRRPDNTVVTSDCRERLRAARKKGLLIFAGTLLIVLWAQICAQFIGLMGLKRMMGGGEQLMGEPAPIAVPGQVAWPMPEVVPPSPPPTVGVAPLSGPEMGGPRPSKSRKKPPTPRLMGKPGPTTAEKMGKIRLPLVDLDD